MRVFDPVAANAVLQNRPVMTETDNAAIPRTCVMKMRGQKARPVPICIEMDADLPSLDQLRNNAAECIRLAEAARTSEHKSFFIEMAERWLTLAENAEKTRAR
jgi:hypothetical protein